MRWDKLWRSRAPGESGSERDDACAPSPAAPSKLGCPISFFVVGAQKAGTTAMTEILDKQRLVFLGKNKGTHFLDPPTEEFKEYFDQRPQAALYGYQAHFPSFPWDRVYSFDGTPSYTVTPWFMENYRWLTDWQCDDPPMVMLIRNPIVRAMSSYKMFRDRHLLRTSFNVWIKLDLDMFDSCKIDLLSPSGDIRKLHEAVSRCYMGRWRSNVKTGSKANGSQRRVWNGPVYRGESYRLYSLRTQMDVSDMIVFCFQDFLDDNPWALSTTLEFLGIDSGEVSETATPSPNVAPPQTAEAYAEGHGIEVNSTLLSKLRMIYIRQNEILKREFGIDCSWLNM